MDLKGLGLSDDDLRQLGYDVKGKGATPPGQGPTGRRPGAGSGPPPRRPWAPATRTWLATLVILSAVGWLSSSGRRLPSPAPAAGPDAEFSSGRAVAQLVDVSQQPRPTGSPENERVRGQLLGRLSSLGLEPEVQEVTAFVRDSALVRAATVRNVLARLDGSSSTGAILVTAHYDGVPLSPGAGDDGIGVATVLETVRALVAGPPLRNDVMVLFTDGDEVDQLGSRAFADHHAWMSEVSIVLSVEARGVAGPAVVFETGSENGRVIEMLAEAEPRPEALSLARALRGRGLESATRDPLLRGGTPAFGLAVLGEAEQQHQPRDTRERVSEQTVQHAGRQLLAMTRSLGGIDLEAELAAPVRAYMSLPGIGLVHYPRSWVLLGTLALLALWVLMALVLRGRRATRRGVALAAVAGVGVVGASALIARALRDSTAGLHPEYGTLRTAFYEDGSHVLAVAALALACSSIIYGLVRRWARTDELVFSGLAMPLAYSVWLTYQDPSASASLQAPLALSLVAGGLVIVLGPNRVRSVWTWAVLVVLAAATLVLVVPAAQLLAAVWTFRSATELGAVFGVATLLFWPLMDRLLAPRAWWMPLGSIGVAGVLVALGLPAVRGADGHPVPTTLLYLTDSPVSVAPVNARGPDAAPDASRVRSMTGKWLTVPGPGEEWARSWAGDPAAGSTDPGVLLMPAAAPYVITGTAPVTELAPPRVTVTGSTDEGGRKSLDLALERGLPGEMVGIQLPDGAAAALTGVGGARWDVGASPVRSVVHWGAPSTPELHVRVQVDADATEVPLVIVEHHLRPREVLGSYFFQRADSLVANATLGSDRVIQRTRITVPLRGVVVPR